MFNELRVLSIKIIIYKKGEIDGTKRKYVICYTTRIFKREVQNGSLAHLMAPQRRSRCHADADFHAQPALADLGAAHRKPGPSPMSPWMSMGLSSMGSVMRSWPSWSAEKKSPFTSPIP